PLENCVLPRPQCFFDKSQWPDCHSEHSHYHHDGQDHQYQESHHHEHHHQEFHHHAEHQHQHHQEPSHQHHHNQPHNQAWQEHTHHHHQPQGHGWQQHDQWTPTSSFFSPPAAPPPPPPRNFHPDFDDLLYHSLHENQRNDHVNKFSGFHEPYPRPKPPTPPPPALPPAPAALPPQPSTYCEPDKVLSASMRSHSEPNLAMSNEPFDQVDENQVEAEAKSQQHADSGLPEIGSVSSDCHPSKGGSVSPVTPTKGSIFKSSWDDELTLAKISPHSVGSLSPFFFPALTPLGKSIRSSQRSATVAFSGAPTETGADARGEADDAGGGGGGGGAADGGAGGAREGRGDGVAVAESTGTAGRLRRSQSFGKFGRVRLSSAQKPSSAQPGSASPIALLLRQHPKKPGPDFQTGKPSLSGGPVDSTRPLAKWSEFSSVVGFESKAPKRLGSPRVLIQRQMAERANQPSTRKSLETNEIRSFSQKGMLESGDSQSAPRTEPVVQPKSSDLQGLSEKREPKLALQVGEDYKLTGPDLRSLKKKPRPKTLEQPKISTRKKEDGIVQRQETNELSSAGKPDKEKAEIGGRQVTPQPDQPTRTESQAHTDKPTGQSKKEMTELMDSSEPEKSQSLPHQSQQRQAKRQLKHEDQLQSEESDFKIQLGARRQKSKSSPMVQRKALSHSMGNISGATTFAASPSSNEPAPPMPSGSKTRAISLQVSTGWLLILPNAAWHCIHCDVYLEVTFDHICKSGRVA
ncbi:unnamed protein product, partial [Protopolystoma xenopodis]